MIYKVLKKPIYNISMNTFDIIWNEIKNLPREKITSYILDFDYEKYNETIESLLFIAYETHRYMIPEDKLQELTKRTFQTKFRKNLIKKYGSCIITKKNELICQASHIIPYSESEPTKRYDTYNGLLLCSELHTLFDNNKWSISPAGIIIMSDYIMNLDYGFEEYKKYDGMQLNLDKQTMDNLRNHYDNFIKI